MRLVVGAAGGDGIIGPVRVTRSTLPVLLVALAAGCATASSGAPAPGPPPTQPSTPPSMPITVHAACGVMQVSALGAVWAASPPYATVVLPPGTSSPYVAPPAGMTPADPRLVEQVPARFTLLDADRARIDGPTLTGPVTLTRLPDGSPMSVCMP